MSTPVIRISKAGQFCTSNLKFFYIKVKLGVHLVILGKLAYGLVMDDFKKS